MPETFKEKFPDLAENLRINQNRLASTFDLHLTIKHILKLAGDYEKKLEIHACKNCQSLFEKIHKNRTCAEAGVTQEWCACNILKEIDKNSTIVQKASNFAINILNNKLSRFDKCAKLELNQILSAKKIIRSGLNPHYLILFEVLPSYGQLEVNVKHENDICLDCFHLIGDASRINSYGNQSHCIKDDVLRNYCYCV